MTTRTFELLTPHVVVSALEQAFDLRLDGTLTSYPSYVNRVYGVRTEEGVPYISKFYRPGRWSHESIMEEHVLVRECAAAELPVVAPIPDREGNTLQGVTVEAGEENAEDFSFSLYPLRSGRNFDVEGDEDWIRLGTLVARIHAVGIEGEAPHRLTCTPKGSTLGFADELRRAGVVHPDSRDDLFEITGRAIDLILPLFEGVELQRIHGDCHRGNILDRPGEGLLIIDFDDMMTGPAVQDLWLLLPGRAADSRRELSLILEGYETFRPFDRNSLGLIEPLRFMRMVYYLAWAARQRDDHRFRESFPRWGTRAFWANETEDLRTQLEVVRDELKA